MNWTSNKSIRLSKGCVVTFAVLVAVFDLIGWKLLRDLAVHVDTMRGWTRPEMILFSVCLYVLSVPAYILLLHMWKLLSNIQKGNVFEAANVKHLRIISYACAGAVIVGLVGSFICLPVLILPIAAAFMMLIVRIIKNIFQQAIEMKSELDLTI